VNELADLLQAVDAASAAGDPAALATIIAVRGSTYRRPGARLLVAASGRQTGNISGGCLEGDVAVIAEQVMTSGRPRTQMYDLTADDDAVWGLGLGCNGAIEVFIEPTRADDLFWRAARASLAEATTVVVATVVEGTPSLPAGGRFVLWQDDRLEGTLGPGGIDPGTVAAAQAAIHDLRPRLHRFEGPDGSGRLFIDPLHPPYRLVACGAGHDAIPVIRLASQLGWRALVVDRREAFLTAERFPGATGFVKTDFADAGGVVPTDEHTYVLIMTHNYVHDRDLLRSFLPTDAGYLGMLGPRARTEKILGELEAAGVAITPQRRAQIFGPVGLDIGSETPEEIALAVLAEILAVARGREGGFLRGRRGPIHTPGPDGRPTAGGRAHDPSSRS
jgi:xanthine dehydrogenase accessory factor